MLICNNCGSTNENGVVKCTTCAMPGMLVEHIENNMANKNTIKPMYAVCPNCGTNETVSDSICQKCHFPIIASYKTQEKNKAKNTKKNIL